jgi:prophage regulatory protein
MKGVKTMNDRILRLPEVLNRTGYKKSTIYDRIKQKEFPSSISLGGRTVGWLESDINTWLEQRIAQRGSHD